MIHSRVIRRYCHWENITLSNRTYVVYDKPQARSAGNCFQYFAHADPGAESPTHVSEYIVRSEYTLVGSICEVRAPGSLDSHRSPIFSRLSTLCDIPTRSIGLERDKTSFSMPLGKRPNKRPLLSKRRLISSTQQATLSFRRKASLLACWTCRIQQTLACNARCS